MNYIKQCVSLLVVAALICFDAIAQDTPIADMQYGLSTINMKDGLPHNHIEHIFKDSHGFMWFATKNGLARYDGYSFLNLDANSSRKSLKGNYVRSICEDRFNRLWIASDGGVNILDLITYKQCNLGLDDEKLLGGDSYSVIEDSRGAIWILNRWNLYRVEFQVDGTVDSCISLFASEQNTPFTAIAEAGGQIWVGYGEDFYIVDQSEQGTLSLSLQSLNYNIGDNENLDITTFCSAGDYLWVGTNMGLIRYDIAKSYIKWYRSDDAVKGSIASNRVTDIIYDKRRDQLIVSTLKGLDLYSVESDDFIHVSSSDLISVGGSGMSNDFFNCLYSDDDLLWIGTAIDGVCLARPQKLHFENYRHNSLKPASLSEGSVNAIFEDSQQNLWVGTVLGGLNLKEKGSDSFDHFTHISGDNSSLPNNFVTYITTDRYDNLWVGTWEGGVAKTKYIKGQRPRFEQINSENSNLRRNEIGSMVYDELNDGMWIGTSAGLDFYDYATGEVINVNLPIDWHADNSLTSTIIDKKQRLWIGSQQGLVIVDLYSFARNKREVRYVPYRYKLDDENSHIVEQINCIFQDSSDQIWIGTNGNGIYKYIERLDGQSYFKNYNKGDGLAENFVFGIEQDSDGLLWISTNNGLSLFNSKLLRFDYYSELDGLISNQFYWNSFCGSRDGSLYFGTLKGLIHIHGTRDRKGEPNRVAITGINISNENILDKEDRYLSYSDNNLELTMHERDRSFSIEFSALEFLDDKPISYQYRLDGYDYDWIEVNSDLRLARYTSIQPGKYRFEVKIASANQSKISRMNITIKPFFYKTWWFGLLILLIVIVIGTILIRNYFKTLKHRILVLKMRTRTIALRENIEALSAQNDLLTHQKQELLTLSAKIKEVTSEKISFFTNITHEFRTPITLIIGPIKSAIKSSTNPQVIEQLQIIERNTKSLLDLVNQLLDFRKADTDKVEIFKRRDDLKHFISDIATTFSHYARERNITIDIHFKVEHRYYLYDIVWMEKVLYNLLSNAIKFTPDGGNICLYIYTYINREGESRLYLSVQDSGDGIIEHEMELIFDKFYQSKMRQRVSSNIQSGTGVGLYLCDYIIKAHGGVIYARNNHRKGAAFRILMPLDRSTDQSESLSESESVTLAENIQEELLTADSGMSQILIVDDNSDMRRYISTILCYSYQTIEAENGVDALEILRNRHIDCILCDWMMPIMDGLELSRQVKSDITISHIPFIMLTAKCTEEDRKSSFKVGVDIYMSKPFDPEELLLRINNTIENRKQHKVEFQQNMNPDSLQITEESRDSKFTDKLFEIIEQHYSDESLNIVQFASLMGMSRSLLNNKMQDLLGLSINKFISTYRLKRAYELIALNSETRNLTISEIAYNVGFSNPKYFSKCFQKEYGVSPKSLLVSGTTGDH